MLVKNFKDISFSSFEALVDILSDCTDSFLFLLDVENNSVFISEQAGAIFDLPGKKFYHATDILLRLVAKEDQSLFSNELDDVISGKKDNFNLNYRALTKSHNSTWVNLRGKVVCFGEEKKSILVGRIEIIDDIIQLDDVSKLPTEVQLRKDFDKVYKQKEKLSGFIMKIDVDKMGEINERHGTRVGDFILSMISDSVKRSIKNFGVAYKINSDEFICMNLKGATAVDASLFYQNLKRSLAEAEQRIDYEEVFTVSAGAVAFFKDSVQLDDLLKKSNFTVSVAKEKGGNNLAMFNATDYSKHQRDLKLQEKLRLAIKNNYEGFQIFYQPVVDAKNIYLDSDKTITNVIGAEGLMRYSCPEFGVVSPEEFIPILEKTGLIIPVSRWLFKTGFKQCREWNKVQKDFHLSLNLSYIQVKKSDVLTDVQMALMDSGVKPENITLELTESGYMDDIHELETLVHSFNKLGLKVDIDDFGTGYSNLRYLQYLNAYTLKLDYSFVHKATGGDQGDSYVIKHITQMAHELNLKVCMEGIEVAEDVDKLKIYDPDKFQGFYFGRPCTADQFREKYIRSDVRFDR